MNQAESMHMKTYFPLLFYALVALFALMNIEKNLEEPVT